MNTEIQPDPHAGTAFARNYKPYFADTPEELRRREKRKHEYQLKLARLNATENRRSAP